MVDFLIILKEWGLVEKLFLVKLIMKLVVMLVIYLVRRVSDFILFRISKEYFIRGSRKVIFYFDYGAK